LLEDLEIDAGLTYLDNEPLGRVRALPLYRERYRLLTSPGSPLSDRERVTWAEVARISLCLLTSDMQNRRILNRLLSSAGPMPTPTMESNSMIALFAHVRTGKWASVMPQKLAETLGLSDLLRSIPIAELEIIPVDDGVDLRMWLAGGPSNAFAARRRRYLGPAGYGMCGLESLAEANRAIPRVVSELRVSGDAIAAALAALPAGQALNMQTRAVHAAGFWQPGQALLVREDVGRHNALDKLAGALAREDRSAAAGIVVLSSRLSVELVQKAAMIGAPVLVAVSAPTALAVRTAEAAGITLVGVGRGDGFEVFTGTQRISRTFAHGFA